MIDIKLRVKRRLAAYKGRHLTCTLEADFKSIFNVIAIELGTPHDDFDAVIEKANEKQLFRINYALDEYQLQKKFDL